MKIWEWYDTSMQMSYYILADTYIEGEDKLMIVLSSDYNAYIDRCDLIYDNDTDVGYII